MNVKTPSLRQSKDGRWLTKWGGKNHYFGRNDVDAARAYAESLDRWRSWRDSQRAILQTRPHQRVHVVDVARRFLDAKRLEGGDSRSDYYAKHLKRFLLGFGMEIASEVRVSHVQAVKNEMLEAGFAPKTINHDTVAIKGMFQWAMDQDLVPAVNLRGCKQIPLAPPPDKSMSTIATSTMIATAPYDVMCWLAVNYLTACRPVEVIRLVHGLGSWTEPGVFRLDESKVATRTKMPRHVVVSDQAMKWLKRCVPRWSRLDSYSAAVRSACGPGGPHPLRHSAATHLHQRGVDRADVDLILGHLPTRVSVTYARIAWQPLREKVARLTL